MVKTHLFVFDVQDITEVVYACPKCQCKMVFPVRAANTPTPSEHCQSCGESILAPLQEHEINPSLTFLKNLRAVLMSSGVKPSLVVPDPDGQDTNH